jgi:hypothetical protein
VRAIERADRLEDYWRDYAFLDLGEELRVAGGHTVQVNLLTLRMFVQLCAVRSPFLVGGDIRAEHVAQILWRLHPTYDARDRDARRRFLESIAVLPFRPAVRAICRFLDRMLIDKPPTSCRDNAPKGDVSFAGSLIHLLASSYGWSADQVLDLTMPVLFQFLRCIQRSNDSDMISFNPLRDRFGARVARRFLDEHDG